ncbi:MAG: hypothetical protein CM15mP16_10780 [Candidatus Pelagibacterales bacterium]|jgi:hypothetical protein|nr:MAG: hypothetical protein CM15mP16_10780 [Pelagibacterales bacterium]|tara:strand:- start:192 stop:833 length:642 start_codon:yes stop_codon:yes gene_type:complete
MKTAKLPLMPKATAIWLVDNTSLSFRQIGDFCGMHELEIKGIADGEVGVGIKGLNPITSGQLTKDEIDRCADNEDESLKIIENEISEKTEQSKKKKKYTPLSKRQDRPDAVYWLIRNHPELKDSQVARLVGSTKNTIDAIRKRTHWNMANIRPQDPIGLGICRQVELDEALAKAERSMKRAQKKKEKEERLRLQEADEKVSDINESETSAVDG